MVAAVVLSGVLGVLLAVAGNWAAGMELELGVNAADLTPVFSALVSWVVFASLAALVSVLVGSGMPGAMIVLADFFVVEVMLGLAGIAWLQPVLNLLPLANSRVLGLGSFNGIEHGRVVAAVILAGMLLLVAGGASWVVRRRPVV